MSNSPQIPIVTTKNATIQASKLNLTIKMLIVERTYDLF